MSPTLRLRTDPYPAYDGFARWAGRYLPAGTRVANVFWSDFPPLFYSAPQYRYLMGLDPMFGYAAMPEQVGALERFTSGERLLSPADLRPVTGARVAFVSVKGAWLARAMEQQATPSCIGARMGWRSISGRRAEAFPPRRRQA